MRVSSIVFGVAFMSIFGVTSGDGADSILRIKVTPQISSAPASVRILAMVKPDAANRALEIVADSGQFYRSSLVGLDGANAAEITETTFKNLPGGEYEVTVTLVGADGKRSWDRRSIHVTSSGAEPPNQLF